MKNPEHSDLPNSCWNTAEHDNQALINAVKQEIYAQFVRILRILLVTVHLLAIPVCTFTRGYFFDIFKTMGVDLPVITILLVLIPSSPYIIHITIIVFIFTAKFWLHDIQKQLNLFILLCAGTLVYPFIYFSAIYMPIVNLQGGLRAG